MADRLQAITQRDFSGGINAVTNPFLIGEKQAPRIRNLILDEHGSLSTRDGYTIVAQNTAGSDAVVWRSSLNRVDGSSFPYVITLVNPASPTDLRLMTTSLSPWTDVGTLVDGGSPLISAFPQSVTMSNQEVFAAGYSVPRIWNGTVLSAMTAAGGQTVPPGAMHLAFHLESLWVWNTNDTTTTLDGPSSLRMSDPQNANSWPNLNQTFISKDDGQIGMGLASFTIAETGISPTQTLVAFKNYSTYQITGVLTLDGSGIPLFSIQKVKSDMGCIAPRTIQFVSGFGLIRLTHKGFSLFNGVNDVIISEEVRPYIFGHDEISPLNFDTVDRSYAGQSGSPLLYIAACPVVGHELTRIFVYDLVRRAWTICDFPVAWQSINQFVTPTIQPQLHAGSASGLPTVYGLFKGDMTDNGAPIGWSLRTKRYFVSSFMRFAYWRRCVLDFAYDPTQIVQVSTSLAGLPTTQNATLQYTLGGGGATWGNAVWGNFAWSTAVLQDGQQSLDIMQAAPSVSFDISGIGFVRLRGLEIQARSQPLTKMVR